MNPRFVSSLSAVTAAAASLFAPQPALAASGYDPARGAPLDQLVIATLLATGATAFVIWVAAAHRSGRIAWLGRLAAFTERRSGLPGWAALPGAVCGVSLLVAVFGFYWDVAKHIDTGRDPGPFGTPAHYPILIGLFGIAVAGFLAIALGAPKRVPTSVQITRNWNAPLGGFLIFLCGACGLAGFPLDDIWHRLFGQDVTLWGPTHIQMVGGASLATLGVWVLLVEGRRARAAGLTATSRSEPAWLRLRTAVSAGAFLIGLSTLQGEFDFGVPQFQLVYQPILIMLAAGIGLVAARVCVGRGGALQAVAFFLLVRGLLSVVVGPVFGLSALHFPLYIAEALVVELVGLRLGRNRPLLLGAVSGILIGTVGLAAEWAWSHVWMPLPWPSSALVPTATLGILAAVSGGIAGGWIGRALNSDSEVSERAPRWLAPAALAAVLVCLLYPLPMNAGSHATAAVTLTDVNGPPGRAVQATVALSPPDAGKDSQWVAAQAWQGGGLVVDRLRPVSRGIYQTTQPIPVYGNWKAMLRLENGRSLRAVPIYLPADPAIPAPEVPAQPQFVRAFVPDKQILQRESVGGSRWLTVPAYLGLAAIAAGWLLALAWGLRRLETRSSRTTPRAPRPAVGAGQIRTEHVPST